ncbi:MAG: TrbI/VirB10 family protein [Gammaproteobacteria bacterium]|jgi:type IV secretion system protein VirB10
MREDDKHKSEPFTLRVKPQSTIRINRGLVFCLIIIGALFFCWVIFSIFQTPTTKRKQTSTNLTVKNSDINNAKDADDTLKQLPKNYSDIAAIKKYLISSAKPVIPPEIEKEIEDLKNQQAFLQQRIADLLQHQLVRSQSVDTQRIKQANTSGIFFAGATPPNEHLPKPSDDQQSSKTSVTQNSTLSSDKQSAYNAQNMQAQKMAFLQSSDKDEDVYDKHPLLKPISPYEVQAGTIIPAELITAINTTLPGSVIAQIRQNVFDTVSGSFLLIPKGSKLLGEYQSVIAYGQERVLIAFTRIIRPDGSSIQLDKYVGTDVTGQSGMKGNVDNHWGRVLGAATLSTLLSVGAGVAADNNYNNGNPYWRSSRQNAILGGASSISQTGTQLTEQAMNIQPTLTIPIGYEFNVIVKKDMIMEPYLYKQEDFNE